MSLTEPPRAPHVGESREPSVMFDRAELDLILALYGRMVAAGEWRDYALDRDETRASFCVYRRTSERPLFRIEKTPANARRQGAYTVQGQQGQVLKRGQSLASVLGVFETRRFRLVDTD